MKSIFQRKSFSSPSPSKEGSSMVTEQHVTEERNSIYDSILGLSPFPREKEKSKPVPPEESDPPRTSADVRADLLASTASRHGEGPQTPPLLNDKSDLKSTELHDNGAALQTLQDLLDQKSQQLEHLQSEYDDFVCSSKEYEQELETEVENANCRVDKLLHELANSRVDAESKLRSSSSDAHVLSLLQSELEQMKEERIQMKRRLVELEQENEDLSEHARIQETSQVYATEQYEAVLEEKILLKQDLEDLQREFEDKEARLNASVQEYIGDISALRVALEDCKASKTVLDELPLTSLRAQGPEAGKGRKKKLCLEIREKAATIVKFIRMVQENDEICQTKDSLGQLERFNEHLELADKFSKKHLSLDKI